MLKIINNRATEFIVSYNIYIKLDKELKMKVMYIANKYRLTTFTIEFIENEIFYQLLMKGLNGLYIKGIK